MHPYKFIFFVAISILFVACSATEETQKEGEEKKQEVYVFDEIPTDTLVVSKEEETKDTTPPTQTAGLYYVQIGAFTTQQKADEFSASATKILKKQLAVSFNKDSTLYVVRLNPVATKDEADKLRDEVKMFKEFLDAFVVVPE